MSDEEFRFPNGKLARDQISAALYVVLQGACAGNAENLQITANRLSEVVANLVNREIIVGYPHFEYLYTGGFHHIDVQARVIMGYWIDSYAWQQTRSMIKESALEGVYVHPTLSPSIPPRESGEVQQQLRPRRRQ